MTTRTFPLWMLWFRFLRFVRTHRRRAVGFVRGTGPKILREGPQLARWLRDLLLAPFWIMFEFTILAWEALERAAQQRWKMRARTYHRALFCVGLSLTTGQAALLVITGVRLSEWTFLFSVLYGLLVFFAWKRGARFLRKILGVRPVRSRDADHPFAGLDLGN